MLGYIDNWNISKLRNENLIKDLKKLEEENDNLKRDKMNLENDKKLLEEPKK